MCSPLKSAKSPFGLICFVTDGKVPADAWSAQFPFDLCQGILSL